MNALKKATNVNFVNIPLSHRSVIASDMLSKERKVHFGDVEPNQDRQRQLSVSHGEEKVD